MPFCLFSYTLIIALIEFYNSFFEEISDLKISKSDLLEKFSPFIDLIEKNLDEVKKGILTIMIYTTVLVVSSIFHLMSSFFFKNIANSLSRRNFGH